MNSASTSAGLTPAISTLTSEADYPVFSYLNPAGTASLPGKTLYITGIRVGECVAQAAASSMAAQAETTPTSQHRAGARIGNLIPLHAILGGQESILGASPGTVRTGQYIWNDVAKSIQLYDLTSNANTFGTSTNAYYGPEATFLRRLAEEHPDGVLVVKLGLSNLRLRDSLREQALDELIDKELLWQEAGRLGIVIDDQQVTHGRLAFSRARMRRRTRRPMAWPPSRTHTAPPPKSTRNGASCGARMNFTMPVVETGSNLGGVFGSTT